MAIFLKKLEHVIILPRVSLLRTDEFISIELAENWIQHARTCDTCRMFFIDINLMQDKEPPLQLSSERKLNDFIKYWILYDEETPDIFYQLIPNNIYPNSHFDNSFTILNGECTCAKFKNSSFEISNEMREQFEKIENYEICAFIRDRLRNLPII